MITKVYVDRDGSAVETRFKELKPGDTFRMWYGKGPMTHRVTAIDYPKPSPQYEGVLEISIVHHETPRFERFLDEFFNLDVTPKKLKVAWIAAKTELEELRKALEGEMFILSKGFDPKKAEDLKKRFDEPVINGEER